MRKAAGARIYEEVLGRRLSIGDDAPGEREHDVMITMSCAFTGCQADSLALKGTENRTKNI
jgi:hypothetical protein